jgi:hypothetical protein
VFLHDVPDSVTMSERVTCAICANPKIEKCSCAHVQQAYEREAEVGVKRVQMHAQPRAQECVRKAVRTEAYTYMSIGVCFAGGVRRVYRPVAVVDAVTSAGTVGGSPAHSTPERMASIDSAIICCEPTGDCHIQSSDHGRLTAPARNMFIH